MCPAAAAGSKLSSGRSFRQKLHRERTLLNPIGLSIRVRLLTFLGAQKAEGSDVKRRGQAQVRPKGLGDQEDIVL